VLLSGFSFPTTIACFGLCGFEVHLVDTEPDGFNLDPNKLREELDERTAAVVVTHFLGFPARLEEIATFAKTSGAILVQDACETMNLRVDGRILYEYGDIVTHSFYHPHHLSSFGGGAVVVNETGLHDHVQSVVHWGRACRCHYDATHCPAPEGVDHNFWYIREGVNVEMSELNACFARWQLCSWHAQEAKRWEHWRIWAESLHGLPDVRLWSADGNISPFVFPIGVVPERFTVVTERLLARGVEVRNLMGGAIQRHPAFQKLAHDGLKNCEALGAATFFVGIHQTLSTETVRRAASIVREVLEAA
jgi:CDP-6-deoxy-D-xylo-4-hexulose-3-dehydrase